MAESTLPALVVLGGPMAGPRLVLQPNADVLIGSDAMCTLRLPLPSVQPFHARMHVRPMGATVSPAEAGVVVFVNDQAVTGDHGFMDLDVLWLGKPGTRDAVAIQWQRVPVSRLAALQQPSAGATMVVPPPAAAPAVPAAKGPAPAAATRPPAPAPPAAPRPAPATATAPAAPAPKPARPKAAKSGASPLVVGGVIAALVVLGVGGFFAYRSFRTDGAPPPPAPDSVPPSTVAAAPGLPPVPGVTAAAPAPDQPLEEIVTIVRDSSGNPVVIRRPVAPSAAPTVDPAVAAAQQRAAQVQSLLAQGDAAQAARQPEAALRFYEQVLQLDPQNAAAQAGQGRVRAAAEYGRKQFVPGRTIVQSAKSVGGLKGFSGAEVKRAPDFTGRLEFAMTPASIQPGDSYSLKVFLLNEGSKEINVSGLLVNTTLNGAPSGGARPSLVREVPPQQRAMLAELTGTWPGDAQTWMTEVTVNANKGDSLKSRLTWK
ncbi:MAG TPA: hypothetical protein VII13_09100 [Vicinamibacteria bacterium]|jgi:hypothetical protein